MMKNETLVESSCFNTVDELFEILDRARHAYGPTLRASAVDIDSPDDRGTPPFVTIAEIYDETLSDGSHAFNLRIAMTEA
jgi:hypothetical protein